MQTLPELLRDAVLATVEFLTLRESKFQKYLRRVRAPQWRLGARQVAAGVLEEAVYVGMAVALYPLGLVRWDRYRLELPRFLSGRQGRSSGRKNCPVLLLHGYLHNNSAYILLKSRLRSAGYEDVYSMNLPFWRSVEEMADDLAARVDLILSRTGWGRLDIVAHSLGGLVARHYIQELGGDRKVATLITMGSPHRGTELYFFGYGPAARQMSPRGDLVRGLNDEPRFGRTRVYSIWSPFDMLVVPAENAILPDATKNIRVKLVGHMGLLYSERVTRILLRILDRSARRGVLRIVRPDEGDLSASA